MQRKMPVTGGAVPFPRPSSPGDPFPPTALPGWNLVFHDELDSTNLEAKRRIARGQTDKSLIIAERQTNGQCRHDRLWESPPGKGIWASFIMPVSVPPGNLPQASLVLAIAVREGIQEATSVSLEVKWPNDLLGLGQKCCGLLAESVPEQMNGNEDGVTRAVPLVLGVGINCNQTEDDFPLYLRGVAASLSMLADGGEFSRSAVLLAVARSLDHWFGVWQSQGFSPVRDAWLAHNCTLGKIILLPEGYGHSRATASALDPSGALLALTDSGKRIRLDAGEILFPDDHGKG